MADLRIPSSSAPAIQPSRAEAGRAAQRAFFNAALKQASGAAPAGSAIAAPPLASGARALKEPASDQPPARPMRPGSLLDIKV